MKKVGLILIGLFSFLPSYNSFSQTIVLDSLNLEIELPPYLRGRFISHEPQHFRMRKKISCDSLILVYYDPFQRSGLGTIIPAYHSKARSKVIEIEKVIIDSLSDNLFSLKVLFNRPKKCGFSVSLLSSSKSRSNASFSMEIIPPIFFE